MDAERSPKIIAPDNYKECYSCVFTQRLTEIAKNRYKNATYIVIKCEPNGAGGDRQINPGRWVEFKGMTITATPETVKPKTSEETEYLYGTIPVCSHYPILNIGQEYPDAPFVDVSSNDRWGRQNSYKLQQDSPNNQG